MAAAEKLGQPDSLGCGTLRLISAAELRQTMPHGLAITAVRSLLDRSPRLASIREKPRGIAAWSQIIANWGSIEWKGRRLSGARLYHGKDRTNSGADEQAFLYDDDDGRLLAIATGIGLGELRNGALGVIAAREGAPAGGEGAVLAIVGAGRQAWTQLEFLTCNLSVSRVQLFCRRAEQYASIERAFSALAATATMTRARSPREAVNGADIVVTATSAHEPLVEPNWLKQDVHVNYIGAKRGGAKEIATLEAFDEVFIEDIDQWHREAAAGSFSHVFDQRRFRYLGTSSATSAKDGRSVFFSNCLPGGELAVLAAHILDEPKHLNADCHGARYGD